jgi:hypothetical protein
VGGSGDLVEAVLARACRGAVARGGPGSNSRARC